MKTFTGLDILAHIPKDFKIDYSGDEGAAGTLTSEDATKNGYVYTWVIDPAKVGETYTFTESNYANDLYEVTPQVTTTYLVKETDNRVDILNRYTRKVAKVDLQKIVNGNMGDRTADFTFKVSITESDGKTPIVIENVTDEDGVWRKEIKLKHNEIEALGSLPVGAMVTIEELDGTAYTTTVAQDDAEKGEKKSYTFSVPNQDCLVKFTNYRSVEIDTGVRTDVAPYAILMGLAAGAGAIMFARRRRRRIA